MSYQMPTQSNETIAQNAKNIRFISNEEADKLMAEYKAEKRLKAVKRYLRERAAR